MRTAGRALGFSEEQLTRVAKRLPGWLHDERAAAGGSYFDDGGLLGEGAAHPPAARVATALLDLPRHLGQHSGGMVIAAGRLDEVVPLEPASMPGRVVVQWDKDDCADLGIVKVDLLGLGMMAVLPRTRCRSSAGTRASSIDYAHLPPDDPKVYAHAARRRHRRASSRSSRAPRWRRCRA